MGQVILAGHATAAIAAARHDSVQGYRITTANSLHGGVVVWTLGSPRVGLLAGMSNLPVPGNLLVLFQATKRGHRGRLHR